MAVEVRNGFWFGTYPADAWLFLQDHLGRDQWAYTHSPLKSHSGQGRWRYGPSLATCACGSEVWRLEMDDTDHICKRVCAECLADSRFLPDRKECCLGKSLVFFTECECGNELVNVASGLFLPEDHQGSLALVSVRCTNDGGLECIAVREVETPSAPGPLEEWIWRSA
jgi:hypothetical protein